MAGIDRILRGTPASRRTRVGRAGANVLDGAQVSRGPNWYPRKVLGPLKPGAREITLKHSDVPGHSRSKPRANRRMQ